MRKPWFSLLALLLILLSACNLPARSVPGAPRPNLAPATLPAAATGQPQPAAPSAQPAAPTVAPTPTAPPPLAYDPARYLAYAAQSGDTLPAVAARFGVAPELILAAQALPAEGLIPFQQTLLIPKPAQDAPAARWLLADSALVNSPCGRAFDTAAFVQAAGGLLSSYSQVLEGRTFSGAEVVQRVATEASVNPRLLLAFIEYRAHWVTTRPAQPNLDQPLGFNIANNSGLYLELSIAANLLNIGYYGWRAGSLKVLPFLDGRTAPIAPALNPGSVAVQYLFARALPQSQWEAALYGPNGFAAAEHALLGDPPACAGPREALFPDGLQAPALELPFAAGEAWALTGGLHADWIAGTPPGALDFAPITGEPPCAVSRAWVRAPAAGVVTRSENGIVQLALLNGAGQPGGWELLLMHVAAAGRLPVGARVQTGDPLGHPSCEGGLAGGSHVHFARLYRGEWIGAGGPFPLVLSGWLAVPGKALYQSTLVKGDRVVESDVNGSARSVIVR